MFDGEPLIRAWVKDFGFGQLVASEFLHPIPCGFVSVAALSKRTPPELGHTFTEHGECLRISRHRWS